MKIEKLQDITSQKGYKINDQYFVPYEGNSQFDKDNKDYQSCLEFIKNDGIVLPEFTAEELLQRAKDNKIAQLKINYEQETIRPHILTNVVKIDKLNKPIGLCNSYFKIINSESLIDSVNIIFAGSFMMIKAFLIILCQESGKNYQDIIKKVFDLSKNTNPAIAASANIPYTSKDDKGNEVRILLSLQEMQNIFEHLFSRIATTSAKYNEIEIKIKNANSLSELDNININF